ncbi:hypothetical protein TSAR_012312, partial [Trichomalopsis sarcophagae]
QTNKLNDVPLKRKKNYMLTIKDNMEEDGLLSPNDDEMKENGPSAAPILDNARAGSFICTEYSALKFDGKNLFKPEEFVNLPIDKKINVTGRKTKKNNGIKNKGKKSKGKTKNNEQTKKKETAKRVASYLLPTSNDINEDDSN